MSNPQEIIKDYLQGEKIVDIVKKHKVSSATVSKILKQNNIQTRYKSTDKKTNIFTERTVLNFTFEEIAKNHGITPAEAKKEFRQQRDKKIIRDYKSKTMDEICQKYGLSNMAVYKILDKNNVPRKSPKRKRKSYPKLENSNKSAIVNDYTNNVSITEILSKHSISKSQLYSVVYEYNLPLRSNNAAIILLRKEISKDLEEGLTRTAIAQKHKISRNLVGQILKGECK